jgi:hypothetical protein
MGPKLCTTQASTWALSNLPVTTSVALSGW